MAILLSDHFNVSSEKLTELGVFDATIGIDTRLFVEWQ